MQHQRSNQYPNILHSLECANLSGTRAKLRSSGSASENYRTFENWLKEATPDPAKSELKLAARALIELERGNPRAAIERVTGPLSEIPDVATRAVALLAYFELEDMARVCAQAGHLVDTKAMDTALMKPAVIAAVRTGRNRLATRILKTAKPTRQFLPVSETLIREALKTGNIALLKRSRGLLIQSGANLLRCLTKSFQTKGAPLPEIIQERAAETLCRVPELITDAFVANSILRALWRRKVPVNLEPIAERFKELGSDLQDCSLRQLSNLAGNSVTGLSDPPEHLALAADWLGIDQSQRQRWWSEVQKGIEFNNRLNAVLQAGPNAFETITAQLAPADWSPVQSLRDQKRPVVLAATHAGIPNLGFCEMRRAGIPGKVYVDTAERFSLLPKDAFAIGERTRKNPSLSAAVAARLQRRRIAVIASDNGRNSGAANWQDGEYEFWIPELVPRLSAEYHAHVFWMCGYWNKGKPHYSLELVFAPEKRSTLDADIEAWKRFYVTALRKLWIEDPRNVPPGQFVRRTANRLH
ncbi:MAG: hypothetical protein GY947_19335 [Rhodobacteraceae bacterium]|nr:hypothetical protein [Paracoccaceae bacterium]